MGKLIKGEFLIATTLRDAYYAVSLGNPRVARSLFAQATVRPGTGSVFNDPFRSMAVLANGETAILAQNTTPFIRFLNLNTGAYNTNPSVLPPAAPYGITLSPDEAEITLALEVNPWIVRYRLSDLAQLAAPSTLPTGIAGRVAYSANGTWIAVPHNISPFVTVYNRSDMSKVVDPATLPLARCTVADFSPDSTRLATGGSSSGTAPGNFNLYNTTATPWTRISTPTFPNTAIRSIRFSPNGQRIAIITQSTVAAQRLYLYDLAANTLTSRDLTPVLAHILEGVEVNWIDNDRVVALFTPAATTSSIFVIFNMTTNAVESFQEIASHNVLGMLPAAGLTRRRLAGTVRNAENALVSRTVRAYHRETGRLVGETVSNAITGAFEIIVYTSDPVYVLAMGNGAEVTRIFDSIAPVTI